jgi:hypothetical protein
MTYIIQRIKTLINNYKSPNTKITVIPIKDKIDYVMICYDYYDRDICIMVYNDSFIKINVDNSIHAICDSIHTVRYELDRLQTYKYYASNI